jgi:hypothetical protein
MMKRKFIAGAVAVSIMMMGAGYAAWTQNFTVTNTVNTGQLAFNAQLVDRLAPQYASIKLDDNHATPTDNAMKLTFTDVYPNSTFIYSVVVKDESTVGVKYDLKVGAVDSKYCEQTYQIQGLHKENEFISLEALNKTLAGMYNQPNAKLFTINVKTDFKDVTEKELGEKQSLTQTLTLNGSQFNAN